MKQKAFMFIAIAIALCMFAGCMAAPAANTATTSAAQTSAAATETTTKAAETTTTTTAKAADEKIDLMLTGIGFSLTDGVNPNTNKEYKGWETYAKTIFADAFPNVNLSLNSIPWENFRAKMQTILQAGDTDLLYASANFIAPFYQMGLLEDLTPMMDADKDFDFFSVYPAGLRHSLNMTDFSTEKLISMPFILGQRLIIYDKQIFDDFGVEYLPEFPTPPDVLDRAERLTGVNPRTGEENYGVFFPVTTVNMSWFINASYYYNVVGCEGRLDNLKDLKWSLNSKEMIETTEFLCKLSKFTPPGFTTGTGNELYGTPENNIAIQLISGGTVPMNYYYTHGEDEAFLERWVPTMQFGHKGEGWTVADGISMSTTVPASKRAVAWECLKFIAGPVTEKWWYTQFGPAPMASLDTSFYNPKDKFIPMNLRTIENAHSSAFEELNPFFGTDIQPTISAIVTNAASGINVDIKAELDALQDKAVAWSATQ